MQPCPKHAGELHGQAETVEVPLVAAPVLVLLSVDETHETERAVAWALDQFSGPQFLFHAVHAYDWSLMGAGLVEGGAYVARFQEFWDTPAVVDSEAFGEHAEGLARIVLHKIAGQFDRAGRKAVLRRNIALRGAVQDIIPEYARKHKCEVLVLGCRGLAGVKKWLSSTSNSLLHHAPCHVALVKEVKDREEAPRNLVLALDGSEHSRKAYAWVRDHVLQPNDMVSIVVAFKGSDDAAGKTVLDSEREFAAAFCFEITKITGHDCQLFLLPGDPRQVITEVLAKLGRVDLLVMGSRGRGVLANLLMGSVVDYCAGAVSCPLLVVK
jgi:nucleotide-binding universal stress UspA family protein